MRNLYVLLALFFVSLLQAQNPAAIDLSFNCKDQFPLFDGAVTQSVTQPDGKIIVIGDFTKYCKYRAYTQPTLCNSIVRFNADLTIDETFDAGNGFIEYGAILRSVALQADGKILVGGRIGNYNGTTGFKAIIRFNTDGSLDTTFNNTSIAYPYNLNCIKVQSDGKILVAGNVGNNKIQLLNPNGSLASSSPPIVGGIITSLDILPNGKIIAGGQFPISSSANAYRVAVFNTDGSRDTAFNSIALNLMPNFLTIQPDGKILVSTASSYVNPFIMSTEPKMVRLNNDGSLDSSFNMGTGFDSSAYIDFKKPVLQANGDIIVYGSFTSFNGNTVPKRVRMHSDGTYDGTYNYVNNPSYAAAINAPVVQADGNILGFCNYDSYSDRPYWSCIRLDPNGYILDNQQPNSTSVVNKIYKTPNGEILAVGGTSLTYGSLPYHNAKLMDADGHLMYHPNLKFPGIDYLNNVMQPDGKLLYLTSDNGHNYRLLRMNADYSNDASFSIVYGEFPNYPVLISLQADGKILMAFLHYTGPQVYHYRLERFNSDGSVDASFNLGAGTGNYNEIYKIACQADGKILVGGSLQTYNGVATNNLVRLNTDGTVDTSFTMPAITNSGAIKEIALQPDGKILVAVDISGLFRLNASDGSFDSSFDATPAPGDSYGIASIALQTDGKILIGGGLVINGSHGIARLNSNGSVDTSFDTGIGFYNGSVSSIVIEPNGKILVGGSLTTYNGTFCNGLVRLVGGDAFLVKGKVKFDSNNNGCDVTDINFPHIKLNIASGSTTNTLITDTTGNYSFTVAPGTYTVTPEVSDIFTISPTNFTVTFPSATSPFVQEFCLASNGNHPDLEVTIVPLTTARPGFDAKYKIIYKNKGNQLHSGSVTLNFNDAVIDLVTATPSANLQTTNNLTWNYTNLLPLEKREILLTFNLNTPTETPPLNSGSMLNYTTTITSSLTDETPNDNTFTFHQNVVNSLDPNDKTCLEGATIGSNEVGGYVHYIIRFENKGTYNAQNISVKDIIDTSKFDINTLTPLAGSHLFVTRITEGNKVEFYFEDINLPFDDATNDGYVEFKIKTKSTLVAGDTFSNAAAIYFDYNSAVNTNTATTTIQALAVKDFAIDCYFTVYPNPANDLLNIEKKENIEITSLSVFNTLGQLIMTIPNAQKTSTIDVSSLRSGNYFLRINSDKGIFNTKFIKL